jgi:glucosamine-6-phosphate deaminase
MNSEIAKKEIGKGTKIPVSVLKDEYEIGHYLAKYIISKIWEANRKGFYFLLGCPSGRSLQSTYDILGKAASKENVDLSRLIIVMMDEYVIKSSKGYKLCDENSHFSCTHYAYKEIMDNVNSYLPEDYHIKKGNIWFPDIVNPNEYDERIKNAGGIDLFLTASGASDGHVAFNPPETSLNSRSRIIPLAYTTRMDNMRTFSKFSGINEVPKYGVSVGLGTIADNSREVILVVHGKQKKEAYEKLNKIGEFSAKWPASFIYKCNNAKLLVDKAIL